MGFSLAPEIWHLIFNFLDGRDGARLAAASRWFRHQIYINKKMIYKMKIHWIQLTDMKQVHEWIPIGSERIPFDREKINRIRKCGYIGESCELVQNGNEVTLFNDFYDIQFIQWEKFAESARVNGYRFYIVKFPERKKFQVLPFKEIHRDGSVIVKWEKEKENKRIKV